MIEKTPIVPVVGMEPTSKCQRVEKTTEVVVESLKKDDDSSQALKMLNQWLPSRDAGSDFWWSLTGPHLDALVKGAGYSLEKQYEALLFHYHWTVPYLGPAINSNNGAKWKSLLTIDGTPIEYSWKWNSPTGKPSVRFTMEAIKQHTGTDLDPLNTLAGKEVLHNLGQIMPDVDLSWTNHFLSTLFDHDTSKYAKEAKSGINLGGSIALAFEFMQRGLSLKTYFVPRRLGQTGLMAMEHWESGIGQLEPLNESYATLKEFLGSSREGKLMNPFMLAVDNAAESRIKFYFQTPHTSFASVREIMTLGGRKPANEEALADLHALIRACTGLPDDYPEDAEIPLASFIAPAKDNFDEIPILLNGYVYHFDIAPGNVVPDVKVYLPVRSYGPDDLAIARGITGWMGSKGRGTYCEGYIKAVEAMAGHEGLGGSKGIQTYVSCLFKKSGLLDITTYMAPLAFHSAARSQRGNRSRVGFVE